MSILATTLPAGVSVVVPTYNSEATLAELLTRLQVALGARGEPFEVIFVNDGSRDGSWAVARELARQPGVRAVNLMRNYGQHNALLCGVRLAAYATTVTIDDDLQQAPEDVPRLLDELGRGFDVVYGYSLEGQHGGLRNLATWFTKRALDRLLPGEIARRASAFRAFRTSARDAFTDFRAPFVSLDALLTWGAARYSAVEVPLHRREQGRSNYTPLSLARHTLNMVTFFTTWPLRMATITGFLFTLLGLLVLVYVVANYLVVGAAVPGFAFLASAISVFSGAQLFALGVIGEYLGRIHSRTLDRPSYAIEEIAEAR